MLTEKQENRKRRQQEEETEENNTKTEVKITLHRREACGKDKRDGQTQKKTQKIGHGGQEETE